MNKTKWLSAITAGIFLLLAAAAAGAQEAEKLTLKRAVTLALQNSHELALARVQYTVAQRQAGVDRAEFRPNLYTGSGAAYSNGFPQTPGGAAPSVFSLSYTQALFTAALPSHPDDRHEKLTITGEVPSALDPPSGCRFHPRCPHAMPQCSREAPVRKEVAPQHTVACRSTSNC